MVKILSIGNSFSQDAQRWIYPMAESLGVEIKAVNLFIGGCSLETHFNNMYSAEKCYDYELNGTRIKGISLSEALEEDGWDIVTLQQASHFSGIEDSYFPYITKLSEYVKEKCPHSKQYIHKTWAYEIDSTHGGFAYYAGNQSKMYALLSYCYKKAAEAISAEIIPVGDVIQYLRDNMREFNYKNTGRSLCRDGFHLSLDYGRYTASAVWLEYLLGVDIRKCSFVPEGAEKELVFLINEKVHSFVKDYKA